MRGIVVRRVALLLACTAGVVVWGISRGKAELHAGLRPLVEAAGMVDPGAQRIAVNGLLFDVASGVTPRSPADVLDDLERTCGQLDAGLGERLAPTWPNGPAPSVFRLDEESTGMVACLDLGREPWELDELSGRLRTAAETGDLAALGGVRIARVRPAGKGAHWVSISSHGPLAVGRAFPVRGDAPGWDLPSVPRPARGRRVLSVRAEGRTEGLASYELPARSDVGAWVERWKADGWALQPLQAQEQDAEFWQATREGASMGLGVARSGPKWVVSAWTGPGTTH